MCHIFWNTKRPPHSPAKAYIYLLRKTTTPFLFCLIFTRSNKNKRTFPPYILFEKPAWIGLPNGETNLARGLGKLFTKSGRLINRKCSLQRPGQISVFSRKLPRATTGMVCGNVEWEKSWLDLGMAGSVNRKNSVKFPAGNLDLRWNLRGKGGQECIISGYGRNK